MSDLKWIIVSNMKWHAVFFLLSLFWCTPPVWAGDAEEYRLKAAFLYNFISFTEWPADVGNTLNLCIYGPDPFGTELDALQAKKVAGRSLVVKRTNTTDTLESCQIVFITRPVISNLSRVLSNLKGKPVLTIADNAGAARQGVILNMTVEQDKILFEANTQAARDNNLVLSSKLLRLAKEVYE